MAQPTIIHRALLSFLAVGIVVVAAIFVLRPTTPLVGQTSVDAPSEGVSCVTEDGITSCKCDYSPEGGDRPDDEVWCCVEEQETRLNAYKEALECDGADCPSASDALAQYETFNSDYRTFCSGVDPYDETTEAEVCRGWLDSYCPTRTCEDCDGTIEIKLRGNSSSSAPSDSSPSSSSSSSSSSSESRMKYCLYCRDDGDTRACTEEFEARPYDQQCPSDMYEPTPGGTLACTIACPPYPRSSSSSSSSSSSDSSSSSSRRKRAIIGLMVEPQYCCLFAGNVGARAIACSDAQGNPKQIMPHLCVNAADNTKGSTYTELGSWDEEFNPTTCRGSCRWCGDGVVEGAEQCDDGDADTTNVDSPVVGQRVGVFRNANGGTVNLPISIMNAPATQPLKGGWVDKAKSGSCSVNTCEKTLCARLDDGDLDDYAEEYAGAGSNPDHAMRFQCLHFDGTCDPWVRASCNGQSTDARGCSPTPGAFPTQFGKCDFLRGKNTIGPFEGVTEEIPADIRFDEIGDPLVSLPGGNPGTLAASLIPMPGALRAQAVLGEDYKLNADGHIVSPTDGVTLPREREGGGFTYENADGEFVRFPEDLDGRIQEEIDKRAEVPAIPPPPVGGAAAPPLVGAGGVGLFPAGIGVGGVLGAGGQNNGQGQQNKCPEAEEVLVAMGKLAGPNNRCSKGNVVSYSDVDNIKSGIEQEVEVPDPAILGAMKKELQEVTWGQFYAKNIEAEAENKKLCRVLGNLTTKAAEYGSPMKAEDSKDCASQKMKAVKAKRCVDAAGAKLNPEKECAEDVDCDDPVLVGKEVCKEIIVGNECIPKLHCDFPTCCSGFECKKKVGVTSWLGRYIKIDNARGQLTCQIPVEAGFPEEMNPPQQQQQGQQGGGGGQMAGQPAGGNGQPGGGAGGNPGGGPGGNPPGNGPGGTPPRPPQPPPPPPRPSSASSRSSAVSSRSSSSSSKDKTYECPANPCNDDVDGVNGPDGVRQCALADADTGMTTVCTNLDVFPCLECRPVSSSSSSRPNLCGNRAIDEGEECGEPGLTCSFGGTCDTKSCQCMLCGNGEIEGDEQCDDGNNVDGDGCSKACKIEKCGDKIIQPGEQCDNGSLCNANPSLSCVLDSECRVCRAVSGGAKRCAGSGFGKLCNVDEDCAGETQIACEYNDKDARCSDTCLLTASSSSSLSSSRSASSANLCGNRVADPGEQCGEPGLTCDFGGTCDTKSCTCMLCGNGEIEGTEQCDDGNNADGDGCSKACKIEKCGDKIVQPGEQCDNGSICSTNPSLSCVLDADCRVCRAVSGGARRCAGSPTGMLCNVDADCAADAAITCEYKEGGNCSNTCQSISAASSSRSAGSQSSATSIGNEMCGNNRLDPGETCDGSAFRCDFGASCKNCVCQLCGNGIREGDESCDDGNNLNNDGCSDKCQVEKCGDRVTQEGEQCDNGSICSQNPSLRCVVDAQCRICGSVTGGAKRCGAFGGGKLCNVDADCADEPYACQYDQAANTTCVNCQRTGSSSSGSPLCGNNRLDQGETCDGNAFKCDFGASCKNCTCQLCGNGIIEGDESCDDGNNANNDGCSAVCQVEKCGDRIVQPGEQCDNGSTCSQNPAIRCVTHAECRTCRAVTGGARRCGGSTTGILCNVDADCSAQTQLTCAYDTSNARCDASCQSTTPVSSSRSSTPPSVACTTDAQCGTCRRCSNNQCVDIPNCSGASSSQRACFNNFDCGNCEQCSNNRCVAIPNCNVGTNGTISTISGTIGTFGTAGTTGTTGTTGGTTGGTVTSICGNGIRERGEVCDDGNQIDDDDCTNNCRRPPEFECTSAAQCESRICRTGRCVQCAVNEECPADHRCVAGNCIIAPPFCGNGQLEPGEQCDDGNTNDRDVCSNDCLLGTSQRCTYDFQCDTGRCVNGICSRCASDDQCPTGISCIDGECLKVRDIAFTPNFCGNGILEPGEACDLGTENSDKPNAACRPDCSRGRCGDGILDRPLEACDDGNTLPGDGCNALCQVEPGGIPGAIRPDQLAQIPFQPGGGAQSGGGTQQQSGGGAVGGDIIRPRPPTGGQVSGDSGPATVAVMAAGAAAGTAWVRRKFGKKGK